MKKLVISLITAALISITAFSSYALEWHQDALGWKLLDKSKNKITSEWYYQDRNQYYFNADGYMSVGWTLIGDNWYYFTEKGALITDRWIDDKYVDYSGKLLINTTTPDGKTVGADGRLIVGNSNVSGSKTSLNSHSVSGTLNSINSGSGLAGSDSSMKAYSISNTGTHTDSGTTSEAQSSSAATQGTNGSYVPLKPIEIKYLRAHMTKDGGISPNIYFMNSSGKIINCIVFTVTPYDSAHNVATCAITGNSTVEKAVMGPFLPDIPTTLGKYILADNGTVIPTSETNVTDYSKTFSNCVVLDHIWLSQNIVTYAIMGIRLQYADGTWEAVNPYDVIKLTY